MGLSWVVLIVLISWFCWSADCSFVWHSLIPSQHLCEHWLFWSADSADQLIVLLCGIPWYQVNTCVNTDCSDQLILLISWLFFCVCISLIPSQHLCEHWLFWSADSADQLIVLLCGIPWYQVNNTCVNTNCVRCACRVSKQILNHIKHLETIFGFQHTQLFPPILYVCKLMMLNWQVSLITRKKYGHTGIGTRAWFLPRVLRSTNWATQPIRNLCLFIPVHRRSSYCTWEDYRGSQVPKDV